MNTFNAGDIIKSAELNENFTELQDTEVQYRKQVIMVNSTFAGVTTSYTTIIDDTVTDLPAGDVLLTVSFTWNGNTTSNQLYLKIIDVTDSNTTISNPTNWAENHTTNLESTAVWKLVYTLPEAGDRNFKIQVASNTGTLDITNYQCLEVEPI